jgi:hypothetical protein
MKRDVELREWVDGGALMNARHVRLHVEMHRNARRMAVLALVVLIVALVNLALTAWQLWLRFGGAA